MYKCLLLLFLSSTQLLLNGQSGTESERINRIVAQNQKDIQELQQAVFYGTPRFTEHSINKGAPYLLKSVNADQVAPGGEKDKCECGQSKGPIAAVGVGVGGAWADIHPAAVDNSTPHTTTVRCDDGVFGVLINNDSRTVQVTCWEKKDHNR